MKCPNRYCIGTITSDGSHCETCGDPARVCGVCGVANRTEARMCRGCRSEMAPEVLQEWAGAGRARVTAPVAGSTSVRPLYHLGFFWFLGKQGEILRVSPYALAQAKPWGGPLGNSFALTPFVVYPAASVAPQEPYLVAMNCNEVRAVSLLNPVRTISLYRPPAERVLLCNRSEDDYLALAAWSGGVAFLQESVSGSSTLVVKPFQDSPWSAEAEPVVVGPVANDDCICFCSRSRLYWYTPSTRSMQSAGFPREFELYTKRPPRKQVNLSPGLLPLSVQVLRESGRAYVLGQIGGFSHYLEAVAGPDLEFNPPVRLVEGAFVDISGTGGWLINAATQVWALTSNGVTKHSCSGASLKSSMPAVLRNGHVLGFTGAPAQPVLCGNGSCTVLQGDVSSCNENTVMGWTIHPAGASLVLRQAETIKIIWWDTLRDTKGIHA